MELKFCPFCGHQADLSKDLIGWKIECRNCAAENGALEKDLAVELWNQRPIEEKAAKEALEYDQDQRESCT